MIASPLATDPEATGFTEAKSAVNPVASGSVAKGDAIIEVKA